MTQMCVCMQQLSSTVAPPCASRWRITTRKDSEDTIKAIGCLLIQGLMQAYTSQNLEIVLNVKYLQNHEGRGNRPIHPFFNTGSFMEKVEKCIKGDAVSFASAP